MARGRFIAFEGGEGTGKSTQAKLLAEALQAKGIDVVATREPGGTPGAEAIRHLLLGNDGVEWGAEGEALLFAAARSDHVAKLIRPALERGAWVVCDRFIDSSRAYQGGGGGLEDADILALHELGSGGLMPDLVFLIEVPSDTAAARVAARDGNESDRIGSRDAAFHALVNGSFDRMARTDPARFHRIDGSGSIESIHSAVLAAVRPLMEDE